jgi:hypothetical protein
MDVCVCVLCTLCVRACVEVEGSKCRGWRYEWVFLTLVLGFEREVAMVVEVIVNVTCVVFVQVLYLCCLRFWVGAFE